MMTDWPALGKVTLKPFTEDLTTEEWNQFYACFRDPEIAKWNGSRPLKMPLWLFKQTVKSEVKRVDRVGFGILDETKRWIGTVELYELGNNEATLGILIGAKDQWNRGYGTDAVKCALIYAFSEMHLKKVRLKTFKNNLRAQKAFEKAGFHQVENQKWTPRFNFIFAPRPQFLFYEITKDAWGTI